jgi:hypothetical protein
MAKRETRVARAKKSTPRAIALADKGINTGADFASVMSALLSDTIAGRVDPQVSNAACNISGKLLKVVELQHKYGKGTVGGRMLALTPIGAQVKQSVQ